MNKNVIIRQIQVKDVMTKSNAPIGGYCVNPYVGCTHGCRYCYASFMKRFTGHTEEWGTFLDVKNWCKRHNEKVGFRQFKMQDFFSCELQQLEEI